MPGFKDIRGARRVGKKLKPIVIPPTVLVPQLAVVMSSGRAVMQVTGTVPVSGDAAGKYLTSSGGLTADPTQATNIRGVGGLQGDPGTAGASAWTPMFAPEADGTRTLIKIADWTGGTGTKPATGYLGAGGMVGTKAQAFNFNSAKKVGVFSGTTNAAGVATIDYSSLGLTAAPKVVALPATVNVLSGPSRSVVSSITATGCTVTVQQQSVLTQVVTGLLGATANVLVIET